MGQDYYGCDGEQMNALERAYWEDTAAGDADEARQLEFDFYADEIPF